MVDVLSQLPVVTVTWKLKSSKQRKPVKQDPQCAGGETSRGQRWVDVGVANECVVVVEITRRNAHGRVRHFVTELSLS